MPIRFSSLALLLAFALSAPAQPPADALWRDLADTDAAKAYQAIWALTKSPRETVAYFTKHLPPTTPPDQTSVNRWIDDLGSDTFAVREKANLELLKLAGQVEPLLKKALNAKPSLEKSRRLQGLLNRQTGPVTLAEELRAIRAVETLERIGSDDAKRLLTTYAAGAPHARLTQEARESLDRLRDAEPPALLPAAAKTDLYGDPLPAGALGRLGTVRFRRAGHGSYYDFVFLPDGKGLITPSERGIQIWEYPSGWLRREIVTAPMEVHGFALAPDGKSCAIGGYYSSPSNIGQIAVRVLELPSGKLINELPVKPGGVFQFALSPDGKLLFSIAKKDGVVFVQEIVSGNVLRQKEFPGEFIKNMAVTSDAECIALDVGTPTSLKLYLWRWRTQKPLEIKLRDERLNKIAFSPDSKVLLGMEDNNRLVGWDVASGKRLYEQRCGDPKYFYNGMPAFAPNGSTMAVLLTSQRGMFRGKIQFLDPATGRSQGILDVGSVGGLLAFAPDSRTLAATDGSSLRFWDAPSRRDITSIGEGHTQAPFCIKVSQNGLIATAGADGTVRLWDAASSKQQWKFAGRQVVRCLAVSPNGRWVAGSLLDDTLRVLDCQTGREIYRLAGHGELGGERILCFTRDSRRLASFGDDFYLRVWDMRTGKARIEYAIRPKGIKALDESIPLTESYGMPVGTFDPDCTAMVIGVGTSWRLFEIGTGRETALLPAGLATGIRFFGSEPAISPNARLLLSSNYHPIGNNATNIVSLTNLASGSTYLRLAAPGVYGNAVAFAADGRSFAITANDNDGQIMLYETASGKPRATIRGMRSGVASVAFFPDGRRLASGQNDSTVLIWDLTRPEFAQAAP